MFKLLNLNNQFPNWGTVGFVPQKYTGGSRTSAGLNVYETSTGEIFSDLDFWSLLPSGWASFQAVYCDPTVSGTGTGTVSDPYKSLDSAMNHTAASGKIIYAKPGLYNRAQSFKGRVMNEDTVILPWPGFTGQIIATSRLTNNSGGFTVAADTTAGVWVFSDIRGETSTTIASVYVCSELEGDLNDFGLGKHYTLAASVAACRTTQGSYFVEETADEIYTVTINTGTTSTPDTNRLHILRNTANCSPVNGADNGFNFYAFNVKFLGGSRPFYCAATSGTPTISTYAMYGCEFCFPDRATARDSCAFSASKDIYLIECLAHNSSRDLYNFKAWNDADADADFPASTPVWAQIVMIDCEGSNANFPIVATDANSLANAVSEHDFCRKIMVGGRYQLARGGVIHDTNVTTGSTGSNMASLILGTWAANSQAASDANAGNTDFCIGSTLTENVYGWMYRCQNRDWNGDNSTSTYYVRNRSAEALCWVDNNLFTARGAGTFNALPNFI